MSQRFLKHKTTGNVLIWQGHLASDPEMVEVADAQGTPMNVFEGEFAVVEDAAAKKPRKKKTDDLVVDPDEALSADASRGL